MAASATLPAKLPALPAERFFHASMFFLILTALGTLVSTGKLDLPTCVLAPLAMIYKGIRLWRGQPPELSHTRATWLVICYLGFFHPRGGHFVSHSLLHLPALRCRRFHRTRNAPWRERNAHASVQQAACGGAPPEPRAEPRRADRRARFHRFGRSAVFHFSEIHGRLSGPRQHAAFADDRLRRRRRTGADRRDQEKFRSGDARENRQAGGLFHAALARHCADQF